MGKGTFKKPVKNICYALGSVFLLSFVLIIVSSFKDFEISSFFYGKLGGFATFFSFILPLPGYVLFSLSGAMIGEGIGPFKKKYQNILAKAPYFLTAILSGCLYGCFSLSKALSLPLAIFIGLLAMGIANILYLLIENKLGKKDFRQEGYAIGAAFVLVFLFAVALNFGLNRVSYSQIEEKVDGTLFTPWWNLAGPSAEKIKDLDLDGIFLRGGPSLNFALSSFLLFVPCVFGKGNKRNGIFLSLAVALFLLFGFLSELSVGQYYASDIAWAMLLAAFTISFFLFVLVLPAFGGIESRKKRYYGMLSYKKGEAAAGRALRFSKRANIRRMRHFRRKRNASKGVIILESLDGDPEKPLFGREAGPWNR